MSITPVSSKAEQSIFRGLTTVLKDGEHTIFRTDMDKPLELQLHTTEKIAEVASRFLPVFPLLSQTLNLSVFCFITSHELVSSVMLVSRSWLKTAISPQNLKTNETQVKYQDDTDHYKRSNLFTLFYNKNYSILLTSWEKLEEAHILYEKYLKNLNDISKSEYIMYDTTDLEIPSSKAECFDKLEETDDIEISIYNEEDDPIILDEDSTLKKESLKPKL